MVLVPMQRRDFITLLGAAAAAPSLLWPVAARAQPAAMPIIGLLGGGSPESFAPALASFRQGLQEGGVVEGRNAAIEARWAWGEFDRLPALAADLVERRAAVIVTQTLPAALAAKAATTTIPIVFVVGEDPVEAGLVHTLNRPGGNVTGLSNFMNLLGAKRLELLAETVPNANALALLVNPNNPNAEPDTRSLQAAAQALGRRIEVFNPPASANSRPPSLPSRSSVSARFSSTSIPSSPRVPINWLRWRRATTFRHLIRCATSSRPAA